jgi:hypothetical protein
MQVCSASGNQFFTNPNGKREICEPVAVQMADLAMPDMEEDQPSEMRGDSNSGPGAHLTLNLHGDRFAHDVELRMKIFNFHPEYLAVI